MPCVLFVHVMRLESRCSSAGALCCASENEPNIEKETGLKDTEWPNIMSREHVDNMNIYQNTKHVKCIQNFGCKT